MNVISRLKMVASVSTIALSLSIAPLNVAFAADNYSVTGVESWDTLNIRARPNARSAILGEIPANATGVVSTGEEVRTGRTIWTRVTWKGASGWASKRYLAEDFSYKPVMQQPTQAPAPAPAPAIDRTGTDIYAASTSTQGVYAGPVAGIDPVVSKGRVVQQVVQQPVRQVVQQPVRQVQGGVSHSHPANQCTRSVSHAHPGGGNQHQHRYSCQGNARQQQVVRRPQVQVRRPANNAFSHTHPRNQLTNAVTHAHPGGNAGHQHNYGGQRRQVVRQQQVQVRRPANNAFSHTHPRNNMTNAVTHAHPGGNAGHQHNYGGQRRQVVRQQQVQVRRPANNAFSHTHPRNNMTNAVTHAHPGGNAGHQHNYGGQRRQVVRQVAQPQPVIKPRPAGPQLITHIHPASPYNRETRHTHAGGAVRHVHDFLMPKAAAQPQVRQAGAVAHSHPSNSLTRSVTHSHPNGGNQHSHSYGRR